jgi:meso-butanediol dehydrogenase/(S,S)-butanediol dehydrogenase/diacetyl reductase
MRFADKVCIVTGGSSGIGRATSAAFASEGARVVVVARESARLEETVAEITAKGGRALALPTDVADSGAVRRLVDRTLEAFGRIDVLVNNAGHGIPGTVVDTEEEGWNRLIDVNLKSVYLACKYAIPAMVRQGGGAVVNVASVCASVGLRNRAAYCASKGGMVALTKAMALDHVGENIRINSVSPGTVETDYHTRMIAASPDPEAFRRYLKDRQPILRMGRPEEIAKAILFLASDDCGFAVGTDLIVDGGWTAQ